MKKPCSACKYSACCMADQDTFLLELLDKVGSLWPLTFPEPGPIQGNDRYCTLCETRLLAYLPTICPLRAKNLKVEWRDFGGARFGFRFFLSQNDRMVGIFTPEVTT